MTKISNCNLSNTYSIMFPVEKGEEYDKKQFKYKNK